MSKNKKPMVVVSGAKPYSSVDEVVEEVGDLRDFLRKFNVEGAQLIRLSYDPKKEEGEQWIIDRIPLKEITEAILKKFSEDE